MKFLIDNSGVMEKSMMTENIANKADVLQTLGINLFTKDGKCKDTYQILKELAEIWETFTPIQEEYYANALLRKF